MGNVEYKPLVVATGGILVETGYGSRVWLSLECLRGAEAVTPGHRSGLLTFESLRNFLGKKRKAVMAERADLAGARLIVMPLLPKKLPLSDMLNRYWCALIIRWLVKRGGFTHVHAHSHSAGIAAVTGAGQLCDIVWDVHGDDIAERLDDGRLKTGSAKHCRALRYEKELWMNAAKRIVVSSALGEMLNTRHSVGKSSFLVPCVLNLPGLSGEQQEVSRRDVRIRLGWNSDDVVALYVGSSSEWQHVDYMLDVVEQLMVRNPRVKFLCITGDKECFVEKIGVREWSPASYHVVILPHSEVVNYGVAGDIGLLFREDNDTNRVASPTKFGEYLGMGVPVAVSTVIRDFSGLVQKYKVGIPCDPSESVSQTADAIDSFVGGNVDGIRMRQGCRQVAQRELGIDGAIATYREVYDS